MPSKGTEGKSTGDKSTKGKVTKAKLTNGKTINGKTTKDKTTKGKTTKGKRERDTPLKLLPESQQIFKGSTFYFIPNDDIGMLRKHRIRKTLERGGVWVKEWRDDVTFVVVDSGICHRDILEHLSLSRFPDLVSLVNETFVPECIEAQAVLDSKRRRFRVEGHTMPLEEPASAETSLPAPIVLTVLLQTTPVSATLETPMKPEDSDEEAAGREIDRLAGERAAKEEPAANVPGTSGAIMLEQAIAECQNLQELPMSSPSAEGSCELSDDGADRQEGPLPEPERKRRHSSMNSTKTSDWQSKFVCMNPNGTVAGDVNPNQGTIEIFRRMADHYASIRDNWRAMAYRRVIAILRSHPEHISNREQAFALPNVGPRLAEKIAEIVETDALQALRSIRSSTETNRPLNLFLSVHGVGLPLAQSWIAAGHRRLSTILKLPTITATLRTAIVHHASFTTPIPRSEVMQHATLVNNQLNSLHGNARLTVAGSYRRGARQCGDIDFLLSAPDLSISSLRALWLTQLLPRLVAAGYVRCTLAHTDPATGTKWQGAATLPGGPLLAPLAPGDDNDDSDDINEQRELRKSLLGDHRVWRRVDVLLVPWEERGAALLHFTGDAVFNRSLRLLARKKGWRLNEKGLFVNVGKRAWGERGGTGKRVAGETESGILEYLGVPWRRPEERTCS